MIKFNDDIIFIDCDETLLIPASEELFVPSKVNEQLVDKVYEWFDNGRDIIVWTSNPKGVDWAEEVCKICQIEDKVSACMRKPSIIVDDDHLEYYSIIDPLTLEYRKEREE